MGVFRGRKVVPARTPAELDAMAAAGAVVARALAAVAESVRPGVSTAELDTVAAAVIADAGAVPSFLGYHGFTGTI
ncbi:MAG: M24 family metallopeptidase, partial [Mycobacteriaceae bacterium]